MPEESGLTPHRPPALQPISREGNFSPPAKDFEQRSSPPHLTAHRGSISEQLRSHPSSPRSHRHPSLSQQAIQDLMNNPPLAHKDGNPFEGRDWMKIQVGEIIDPREVHWSESGTSVEEATKLLVSAGAPNVVLIREHHESRQAIGTFDYSDLNAYLLLVIGLAKPDENHISSFNELARRGRTGKAVPLRDISDIGRREALTTLTHTANLTHAVETFGSGVHRIIIVQEGTRDVVGVLTQLRLVRFFWENGRNFPVIEPLFSQALRTLNIGSHHVKSINGDRPLSDALELMNTASITSLPVIDNSNNVVGNISHVDVRLLTKSTSLPLLRSSCIHFISVILSERGMHEGKDSVPVFYVNPYSTFAHTVAKLVATRSHRMWIVDSPSPASSAPQTPSAVAPSLHLPSQGLGGNVPLSGPNYTSSSGPAISASVSPGQNMSGRLSGVISLTDVLNCIARATGLSPHDPDDARRRRARSSSGGSSSNNRISMELTMGERSTTTNTHQSQNGNLQQLR